MQCRELDIFKILGIFEELFGNFLDFWRNLSKNFLELFGGFFGRNVLGEMFLEEFFERKFLGEILLGGFFWRKIFGGIFWEELFVYVVKV